MAAKQPRKIIKPKGQVKEFETKRLPNYLRKQRQIALNAEKDNFFDEVTVTMKNEGATEISDFLQQLAGTAENAAA